MTAVTMSRVFAASVATMGLFVAVAFAQPGRQPDPIEAAKLQRQIAEQKAEAEVLLQIDNAHALAKGRHTAKAIQTLKTAKANLQLAQGISEAKRTQLTAKLDAALAAIEGRPAANPNNPGIWLDPKANEVKDALKEAAAKQHAEYKDVLAGIKLVEKYQAEGKTNYAEAEIARLARLYPNNPSVLALRQNESLKERIADAQAHYAESSRRWVEWQKQMNKSSLPAIYDVEFPANWKELSERRLKANQIPLTDKEKKIIEALESAVTVTFLERPLEEALQDLSNMINQPLLVDKKSLEDLNLDLSRGVTLQAKGISARTALRSVLATQGLTFIVRDEAIQIMTVERAKSLLTTRVYYIGDLVNGGMFSDILWGPFLNLQQQQANVANIIELIRKIDPLSWEGRDTNGSGSILYHAPTQSLIVRNSAEVHYALSRALTGGR